jgi:phage tail-like protein
MSDLDYDYQGSYFGFELNQVTVAFFTACSGLSVELEVAKFKETDGSKIVERKRPGRAKYGTLTLKRGYTPDTALHDWFKSIIDAADKTKYDQGEVVIYDRLSNAMARIELENCWPSKLSVSDLDAKSDTPMVEEMTIQYTGLTWKK